MCRCNNCILLQHTSAAQGRVASSSNSFETKTDKPGPVRSLGISATDDLALWKSCLSVTRFQKWNLMWRGDERPECCRRRIAGYFSWNALWDLPARSWSTFRRSLNLFSSCTFCLSIGITRAFLYSLSSEKNQPLPCRLHFPFYSCNSTLLRNSSEIQLLRLLLYKLSCYRNPPNIFPNHYS